MLLSFLSLAWLCEAWGRPVDISKFSDIQYDEGYINSLNYGHLRLRRSGETALELDEEYAVQEGDILVPDERNAVKQLWPEVDGHLTVPYEIHSGLKGKSNVILDGLKMISKDTCIHFHKRTNETDYLHFKVGNGCASYVGCFGGEQPVLIGDKCRPGNICHEVLHALGFYHEHSRVDRNEYITIHFENIMKGKEDNFMTKAGNTLGLEYDRGSILHYGETYFSRNGKPTIVSKDSGVKIGQRTHMSDLDVERVRRLYHCDKIEKKEEGGQLDASNHTVSMEPC